MMTAPLVEPHRHNVNCCAAIFGRPELGHFEAQGRAIFSPNFFQFSSEFFHAILLQK